MGDMLAARPHTQVQVQELVEEPPVVEQLNFNATCVQLWLASMMKLSRDASTLCFCSSRSSCLRCFFVCWCMPAFQEWQTHAFFLQFAIGNSTCSSVTYLCGGVRLQ